ncbi:MAG: hypothetical protein ACFCUE_01810 [Candidatus Bathyarchaeia archaeon]|jgi:hypothetical protein
MMVEVEVRENTVCECEPKKTELDVNEIINKIGDFACRIKELSGEGKPMAVRLDGFNFSINRQPDMYDVAVKLNLTVKPKTAVEATIVPPT